MRLTNHQISAITRELLSLIRVNTEAEEKKLIKDKKLIQKSKEINAHLKKVPAPVLKEICGYRSNFTSTKILKVLVEAYPKKVNSPTWDDVERKVNFESIGAENLNQLMSKLKKHFKIQ
jgi:hypothetical protein